MTLSSVRYTLCMKLSIGDHAPDFSLPDQDGIMHSLRNERGSWVLLYFYPKDDTPGCTTEACSFRDHFPKFNKLAVTVFGISADSVNKHKSFVEKYALPFTVLSDADKKMVHDYGVWQKKKFMGREYMGIARWSFLINPKGVITHIYDDVKPAMHAEEVLKDLKAQK